MEASNSQGQTGRRSVQQQRRPTQIERKSSIRLLRRYIPYVSELLEDVRNESLSIRQNIFASLLLEELGIVVKNKRETLQLLLVVIVLNEESLDTLGVKIRVSHLRGTLIYYFRLEEMTTWPQRTRTLLLGTEFNRTHFPHLEYHLHDELEGSASLENYNPHQCSQEVEQNVQLEQEAHQGVRLQDEIEQEAEPQQDVQLQDEIEQQFVQSDAQDVQLQHEVEQVQFDNNVTVSLSFHNGYLNI